MARDNGRTAVYRLYDADRTLLYVGATRTPRIRFNAHSETQPWWPQVQSKTVEWFNTRDEALAAESRAVKAENPVHNVRLRADALTVVISVKLSEREAAEVDEARRELGMNRSEFLRWAMWRRIAEEMGMGADEALGAWRRDPLIEALAIADIKAAPAPVPGSSAATARTATT